MVYTVFTLLTVKGTGNILLHFNSFILTGQVNNN